MANWAGPVGWLTEKLTKPKKKKVVEETPVKTKTGWGSTKDIMLKRKRKQEEAISEPRGLRNTYRKAKGD